MSDITLTVSAPGPTVELTADAPGAVTVTVNEGGGASDHGALTGLADDDHTQYAKRASNLSDLASAATARTNLGLGTAAVQAASAFEAAGVAVPKSLVDAKGDIIAATAADTVARVQVGADGTVLTADVASAAGVKWATPAGGAADGGPTFASGWYAGWSGTAATVGSIEDRGHYVPIPVPRSLTIDRIGIEVTSSATGSPTVRLGVYADANGVPGALILDAGTVDASTTGFKEITISQALTAGLVWLACAQQGGTSTGVLRGMTGSTHVGIPAGFSQYAVAAFYASGVTDALAASAPTMESAVGTAPRIMLRVV